MTGTAPPAASRALDGTITIEIGELPISLRTTDPEFRALLARRYSSFVRAGTVLRTPSGPQNEKRAVVEFDLNLTPPGPVADQAIQARCEDGQWHISRGDFRAAFDLRTRRGHLTVATNPYAVDTMLRVVHSILLAPAGGLLLHASGGIRHGRGLLFSGISGAGKTTMARLAPPDVQLLTDEVSYLRRERSVFQVYGTPFSGELGIQGENVSAPLSAIYLIEHGPANRRERVPEAEAVRRLMRNILFFAREKCLVAEVFSTVCDLVRQVPVERLEFLPDARVWETIE
ncbi:MAG TPA: hypothetical protein VKG84_03565 [Candidatus Acidoferrales bacterium]|nr:hypothetical protein [Candidatus Acidoferrales bacterium]